MKDEALLHPLPRGLASGRKSIVFDHAACSLSECSISMRQFGICVNSGNLMTGLEAVPYSEEGGVCGWSI